MKKLFIVLLMLTFASPVFGAEMLRIYSDKMYPSVDDAMSLGDTSNEYDNLYIDGVGYIDELVVGPGTSPTVTMDVVGLVSADAYHFDSALAASPDIVTNLAGTLYVDSSSGKLKYFNPVDKLWKDFTLE